MTPMIALLVAGIVIAQSFEPVVLATPSGARQPQVAVRGRRIDSQHSCEGWEPSSNADGDVHVVYGTPGAVHVNVSTDFGASFSGPREIGRVGALALGHRRGPRIAIAGDTIVVSAIGGEKGGGIDENIVSWRSTDRGASWVSDGRVNEVVGAAREGLHAMAAGLTGDVYCVWIDLEKNQPRICIARSESARTSRWGSTSVVFGDPAGICPCCPPSITVDALGKVYVMWRGRDGGSRDMVIATSNDQGETFSAPTKLGSGTWTIDACPMDGGAIAAGGGRIRSVWRRESTIFRADMLGSERELGRGEQASLVLGADGEYIVWLERRGESMMLLRPRSQEPMLLDPSANDPALAAGPESRTPVFVAWESGPSDAPRILVARIDGGGAAKSR